MKHVKYIGTADYREVSAADFESLGVDQKDDLTFDREGFLELKNAVAEALTTLPTFAGEFEIEGEGQEEAEEENTDTNTEGTVNTDGAVENLGGGDGTGAASGNAGSTTKTAKRTGNGSST